MISFHKLARRFASMAFPVLVLVSPAAAQEPETVSMTERFSKTETYIDMRDGTRLHTTIYAPRNDSREWPILMRRTPYSCRPYGEEYSGRIGSPFLMVDGYIFVCQDVRGRWMSEGEYDNMRPHVPGELPIDESSDTWDSIDWLVKNVPNNNGKVGIYGISYPGFYATAALPEAHPALVAASPQAPISDLFFDDFHHRGAYTLVYFLVNPLFGRQKPGPTTEPWYEFIDPGTRDGYAFYMDLGPLSRGDQHYSEDFLWNQIVNHPNYDEFWQARNILPHLRGIHTAVMTVGGWFDAEDLYGPLNIYRAIEEENPGVSNTIVMGPWSHGDWGRNRTVQVVGDLSFGENISEAYQRDVEAPFFRYWLHGRGSAPDFEALVFDTGRKEWRTFEAWPPREAEVRRLFLRDGEGLSLEPPGADEGSFTEYLSDPNEPVPYTDRIRIVYTPRAYMTEDQRFAERRPDVIEFETDPLTEDLTLAGDIVAHLQVSTTGTDADWVVKLIDVFPDSTQNDDNTPPGQDLGGYQMMVRSEIMRGRFRNSFVHPEPFVPGEVAAVEFPLQDVHHTFRSGHRIMIQIQSTWFPLFDRNPQTFVPNIYRAVEEDFQAATHRVWHTPGQESWVALKVLP